MACFHLTRQSHQVMKSARDGRPKAPHLVGDHQGRTREARTQAWTALTHLRFKTPTVSLQATPSILLLHSTASMIFPSHQRQRQRQRHKHMPSIQLNNITDLDLLSYRTSIFSPLAPKTPPCQSPV